MSVERTFNESLVELHYSTGSVPDLYCPKSLAKILSGDCSKPAGENDDLGGDGPELIDYAQIPTVIFHIVTGVDGELDYLRSDIAEKVASVQNSLAEDEDDDLPDTLEVLQDHICDYGEAVVIFLVIFDRLRLEGPMIYLGLDLSSASAD